MDAKHLFYIICTFCAFVQLQAKIYTKVEKVERLKWHCTTLCSTNGGQAEFKEKTLTCKCYVAKGRIDILQQDVMYAKAQHHGIRLKVIEEPTPSKQLSRRSTDEQEALAEKLTSKTEDKQSDYINANPTRNLPIHPLVQNRLKFGNGSTLMPDVTRAPKTAKPKSTTPNPQSEETTIVTVVLEEEDVEETSTDSLLTTAADSIVGLSINQIPLLPLIDVSKTGLRSFARNAVDGFIISQSTKVALEAVNARLNALIARVKFGKIDKASFLAEIQGIRTDLKLAAGADAISRARAAERALGDFKEKERMRLERFRQLALKTKFLPFNKAPLVGAAGPDGGENSKVENDTHDGHQIVLQPPSTLE